MPPAQSTLRTRLRTSSVGETAYYYRSRFRVRRMSSELGKITSKPKGVFILGMHRSGTSSLAGMLGSCGLYLGNVSQYRRTNKKGHQEGRASWVNEELLRANGGTWYSPIAVERVPPKYQTLVDECYLELAIGAYRAGYSRWAIKDPRMLFCLPAWSGKEASFVATFRHPAKVVSSLLARQERYVEKQGDPWELWYQYNSRLLSLYLANPFPIVNFDWDAERYRTAVQNIARDLDLNPEQESFFEPGLVNQGCPGEISVPECRMLYEQLESIADTEERRHL